MYNENEWRLEHAPFVKIWITFPVLNVITQMPPVTYPERSNLSTNDTSRNVDVSFVVSEKGN